MRASVISKRVPPFNSKEPASIVWYLPCRIRYEVITMTFQAQSVMGLSVLVFLLLVGSANAAEPLTDKACHRSAKRCEFSITADLRYTMVFSEQTTAGPKWVPMEAREDGLYTTGAPGNCEGEGRKLSEKGEAARNTTTEVNCLHITHNWHMKAVLWGKDMGRLFFSPKYYSCCTSATFALYTNVLQLTVLKQILRA